jgi:putative transposase
MRFIPNNYYHVFNQGNNKQTVFFKDSYYDAFLSLYKRHVQPHCITVNFSLMPNHFHFLIYCDERFVVQDTSTINDMHPISEGFRKTLSRYARIINDLEGRSGSLFRQNTKAKCLQDEIKLGSVLRPRQSYLEECFYYIHQNPLKAGLVGDLAHWRHSAYAEYTGLVSEGICDLERAERDCGFDRRTFRDRCHIMEIV